MALEHPRGSGDGCLTVAIRMPVRIVAFAVVLPLRLLWDAAATAGRGAGTGLRWTWRRVLLPPLRVLGVALARLWRTLVVVPALFLCRWLVVVPLAALWRYVLAPAGRGVAWTLRTAGRGLTSLLNTLVVIPLTALWRHVLAPAGRAVRTAVRAAAGGLGAGASWLGHHLLVVPARWLWRSLLVPAALALAAAVVFLVRHGLVPVGRGVVWALRTAVLGLSWLLMVLVEVPAAFVWRRIVVPVAREIGTALGFAWRAAGYVSRAVGRGLKWLGRVVIVIPAAWVWQRTGAPVVRGLRAAGRWYGRAVRQPLREAVAEARRTLRQLRAETRRALLGEPAAGAGRLPPQRAGHEPSAFGPAPATEGADLMDAVDGPGGLDSTDAAGALVAGAVTERMPRHRRPPNIASTPDLTKRRSPGHR
jgi:hypothetical protein